MSFTIESINQAVNAESRARAQELLSKDIPLIETVYGWLKEPDGKSDRAVDMLSGTTDDTGEEAVYLLLLDGTVEVAVAWARKREIVEEYQITMFSSDLVGYDSDFIIDERVNDKWYAKRDRCLQASWSELLAGKVVSPDKALLAALSYACSNNGEAHLVVEPKDCLVDMVEGDEDLLKQLWGRVYFLALTQGNKKRTWAHHEHLKVADPAIMGLLFA